MLIGLWIARCFRITAAAAYEDEQHYFAGNALGKILLLYVITQAATVSIFIYHCFHHEWAVSSFPHLQSFAWTMNDIFPFFNIFVWGVDRACMNRCLLSTLVPSESWTPNKAGFNSHDNSSSSSWKDANGLNTPLSAHAKDVTFRVDFKELRKATDYFDEDERLIGRGASCRVFKGVLFGRTVAIKVFTGGRNRKKQLGSWEDKVSRLAGFDGSRRMQFPTF